MASVLIIDDDEELAQLLGDYLSQEGFDVTLAHNGDRALGAIVDSRAEIVVLDVMMPGLSGIEVLRRIRRESAIPVLMLTARGDEVDRISGLDLGADDYLAKPCSPGELAARIRAVLRRTAGTVGPQGILKSGDLILDPQRRIVTWQSAEVKLTGIEFNILEVLLSQAGTPVPRAELYQRGVGRPIAPYDRSLDVHISAIRQKLGTFADGRSPIENVRGIGYQLLIG